MEIRALGYRTDLALLGYGGSEVEDRGTHVRIRTPQNPRFYWGNFLLLPRVPDVDEAVEWLQTFRRELPEAEHLAFGIDVTEGAVDDLAGLASHGLEPDASVVMTASEVHEPPKPHAGAVYRPLGSDDDWQRQVELSMVGEETGSSDAEFVTRRAEADRRLVDQGRGQWWGAFVGDQLLSSMGLFVASEGLARFQNVKTHPEARGQGLAGTLVHRVSRYGLDDLGAHTLVMVADPDYAAIRIYRGAGFTDTERQLGCQKAPSGASPVT
ncbi:MAG: GNAT family N-acetyltransferase [Lapillicoccus sp.]